MYAKDRNEIFVPLRSTSPPVKRHSMLICAFSSCFGFSFCLVLTIINFPSELAARIDQLWNSLVWRSQPRSALQRKISSEHIKPTKPLRGCNVTSPHQPRDAIVCCRSRKKKWYCKQKARKCNTGRRLSLILFFCFARRAAVVHWSCWTFRGQSLRLHKKIINIKKRNRSLELHSMPLGSYCSIYITTTVSLNVRRAPTNKGGGFQL